MPVLGEIIGWEILVPLALIALLFGSAKIPQLARSLGQAQREFHRGIKGDANDGTPGDEPDPDRETPPPAPPNPLA